MLDTARPTNQTDFSKLVEPHRHELQVHCYRMLGSLQDAEDLVQETLLRAWQKLDTYAGRASFRAWLYKIATNACLDTLDRRPRRTLPPAYQVAADPNERPAAPITEPIWLEPIPDDLLADIDASPEARYDTRESITLAFLAAMQSLPPRQRAVLILRDVLDWHAEQVAQLLDLTVSAVNSALHRARVTLAKLYHTQGFDAMQTPPSDDVTRTLLDQYVSAWENADIDALVALLKEDAILSMPPSPSWYQGRDSIRAFVVTIVPRGVATGHWRFVPTRANGQPAFAWYQRDEHRMYRAFAIMVVESQNALVSASHVFMNPALFTFFKMPLEFKA